MFDNQALWRANIYLEALQSRYCADEWVKGYAESYLFWLARV